jgi:hypothetical protein
MSTAADAGLAVRHLKIAHALPGRTRFRVHGLPLCDWEAPRLEQRLGTRPDVSRVEVNCRTGSVLVEHDEEVTPPDLEPEVRALVAEGTEKAAEGVAPVEPVSKVARELAVIFRDLDVDLREATRGKLDIAMLAVLVFLAGGGVSVAGQEKLPAPPWFNLAWWGFRTFMTLEERIIADVAGETAAEDDED